MLAQLRNVQTGEIRPVELDSDEFRTLVAERYDVGDGRAYPRWEQTGDQVTRRIDEGKTRVPEDFGTEDSDIGQDNLGPEELQGLGADPHPEQSLTAAEKEAGIESYEHKLELQGRERTGQGAENLARGLERVGIAGDGAGALESTKAIEEGSSSSSGNGGPTKADLKAEADDLGLTGTSSMNKAELQEAIDAERSGSGSGSGE